MPLPNKLTKFTTASPAVATYTFSEFASGSGFIKFFFAGKTDSTGTDYILTERAVLAAPSSVSLTFDLDFDLSPFNKAVTIEGTSLINLTTTWGTAGGTNNFTYTIIIRKWDGTTETDLVTVVGATVTVPGSTSGTDYQLITADIPKTNFAQGEQLRVTITSAQVSGSYSLAIDPADRGGTNANSSISIPFRINI